MKAWSCLALIFFQTAVQAMAEETRVYLSGIPFLMNEEWLRMHLKNSDIRTPWKVVILRKGWHRSRTQWANAFLWYNSKEEAQAVATSLDGLTLPGWWKPFKAQLAWTDPNWSWPFGCKFKETWAVFWNCWFFHVRNIWCHSWHWAHARALFGSKPCVVMPDLSGTNGASRTVIRNRAPPRSLAALFVYKINKWNSFYLGSSYWDILECTSLYWRIFIKFSLETFQLLRHQHKDPIVIPDCKDQETQTEEEICGRTAPVLGPHPGCRMLIQLRQLSRALVAADPFVSPGWRKKGLQMPWKMLTCKGQGQYWSSFTSLLEQIGAAWC